MNTPPEFDRKTILLASLFAFALVLISGGLSLYVLADPDIRLINQFAQLALHVEQSYSDRVDPDDLIDAARDGMIDPLDRYCSYIERDQMAQMREELSGSYSGIGVTITTHLEGLFVVAVSQGGPAWKAGIRIADLIIDADSVSFANLSVTESSKLLRGNNGEIVSLTIHRFDARDTLSIKITRSTVPLQHIPYAGLTTDSMIYVLLSGFEAGTAEFLEETIDSLLDNTTSKPKGMILDLRGNPGGLLSEACHTAELFMPEGELVVGTDGRSIWEDQEYLSANDDLCEGLPLAVLVDRRSASSSEIVAGALQQHHRAILVGDTTFGKGLVQGYSSFPDGSGMRLTISRYYLEGGLYLNQFDSTLSETGSGLVPDHYLPSRRNQPFWRFVENSLLLQQFAALHQDSLIAASEDSAIGAEWVDLFINYATERGLIYTSASTREAELIVELSMSGSTNQKLIEAAQKILLQAQKDDMDQFELFSDLIRDRLAFLARERKFGQYQAYVHAFSRERPYLAQTSTYLMEFQQ